MSSFTFLTLYLNLWIIFEIYSVLNEREITQNYIYKTTVKLHHVIILNVNEVILDNLSC